MLPNGLLIKKTDIIYEIIEIISYLCPMKNVENIVFKLIDDKIKTADVYHNGGSLWLIFTEEKKWMIEFTSEGILWYNFQFFNTILTMVGLIEHSNAIVKKWYE